jgi:hypothetical protein
MQPCRYCYQEVDPKASRCPHCRSDLTVFGKLRLLQPIASVLIAVGGSVYGFYERTQSQKSLGEYEMEQAALAKVLQSASPQELAAKYQNDPASEDDLKKELRRNPRNVDARIRLRLKQHSRNRGGRTGRVAGKSREAGRR